jgi:hypothetical protein
MSNQWLRLWHDMPNDPKWRTIARVSSQPLTAVISVYVHMLVCASKSSERGQLQGWSDEDIASALDLETEQVAAIHQAMQGRVMDGDMISGWENRQPVREDGSAERAKAWREAKKRGPEPPEPPPERARTQANASERQDKDKDLDTEESSLRSDSCAESPQADDSTPTAGKITPETAIAPQDGDQPQQAAMDPDRSTVIITLTLNTGKEHPITARQVSEWAELYPAVDVRQELRNMRGWLVANPKKRKTRDGVLRFINGWLSREQDQARDANGTPFRQQAPPPGSEPVPLCRRPFPRAK